MATIFAAVVSIVIYGGTAIASTRLDHNSGIVLIIPILVAVLCGIVCLFQIPGAFAEFRSDPKLKNRKSVLILSVGTAMALIPACVLLSILALVFG